MGIAYTPDPSKLVYQTAIDASTSANLRSALHGAVTAAGWTVAATLTNGRMYALESPQGLAAKCRIQDTGRAIPGVNSCVDVQFRSFDEVRLGKVHDVCYGASAGTLQVWANQCQLFISRPGASGTRG